MLSNVGAVAIGRNEGERLATCLRSLAALAPRLVYVDSGSTDNSLDVARQAGAEIVTLDVTKGFTAARARNAGWRRLHEKFPEVAFVQFVDGDCEVDRQWLTTALDDIARHDRRAAVCGRRRERFPEASIYNRLCDLEWNTRVGVVNSCGGDALVRMAALRDVDGYNDRVIAGEEPELCVRWRARGWTIARLDAEMTLHDAAMTRWQQWFKRAQRAGHAYAEGFALHGRPPERHNAGALRGIVWWACLWPLAIAIVAPFTRGLSFIALAVYPVQALRTAWRRRQSHGDTWSDCLLYGLACTIAKFPQLMGAMRYLINRSTGRSATIMEYKGPATASTGSVRASEPSG